MASSPLRAVTRYRHVGVSESTPVCVHGIERPEHRIGGPFVDHGPFAAPVGPGLEAVPVGAGEGLDRVGIRWRRPPDLHHASDRIADLDRRPGHDRHALVDFGARLRPHLAAGAIRHDGHDAVAVRGPVAQGLRVEIGVVGQPLDGGHQRVPRPGRHADLTGALVDVALADSPVDLVPSERLNGRRVGVPYKGGLDPIHLDRIADGRCRRGHHRTGKHADPHGFHIRQGHRVRIRCLEDDLIRGQPHGIATGCPPEGADIGQRIPAESGIGLEILERPADRRHRHGVAVGVGCRHREGQRLALQDARVERHLHHRRLVGAGLDINLHVADDLSDHEPLPADPPPFADAERHVVLSGKARAHPRPPCR